MSSVKLTTPLWEWSTYYVYSEELIETLNDLSKQGWDVFSVMSANAEFSDFRILARKAVS